MKGNQEWTIERRRRKTKKNEKKIQTKQNKQRTHNTGNSKDEQHGSRHKTGGETRCSQSVSSSFFLLDTSRVTHIVKPDNSLVGNTRKKNTYVKRKRSIAIWTILHYSVKVLDQNNWTQWINDTLIVVVLLQWQDVLSVLIATVYSHHSLKHSFLYLTTLLASL